LLKTAQQLNAAGVDRAFKTKSGPSRICLEASTGFEPVMRVLQTLALPLGHDAISNTRAGDGIRTHDLLLGKETFYH
jgi:hypothetical protein